MTKGGTCERSDALVNVLHFFRANEIAFAGRCCSALDLVTTTTELPTVVWGACEAFPAESRPVHAPQTLSHQPSPWIRRQPKLLKLPSINGEFPLKRFAFPARKKSMIFVVVNCWIGAEHRDSWPGTRAFPNVFNSPDIYSRR